MNWNEWILQKNAEFTLNKLGLSKEEYLEKAFKSKSMLSMYPHSDTHMVVRHGSNKHIMTDDDARKYVDSVEKLPVDAVGHARDTGMAHIDFNSQDGSPSKEDDRLSRKLASRYKK